MLLQSHLLSLGFICDIDGIFGKDTLKALNDYQLSKNIQPTNGIDLDDIDIYNELTQIDEDLFLEDDPDWWTEQELEAIYNNDLELLEKLIKERCPLDGEDN